MKPDDIVKMGFDGTYEGTHRPSSEWRFHRDILRERDGYRTRCCTATRSMPRRSPCITSRSPRSTTWSASPAAAPSAAPATPPSAPRRCRTRRSRRWTGGSACLLGQHGQISLGKTLGSALWLAIEVETLARMYVQALPLGEPPVLPEEEMARVIEQMRRMSYGQMPEPEGSNDVARPKAGQGGGTQTPLTEWQARADHTCANDPGTAAWVATCVRPRLKRRWRCWRSGRGRCWPAAPTIYPARVLHAPDEDILDISALSGLRGDRAARADHWFLPCLATWSDLIAADLPPAFDGLKRGGAADRRACRSRTRRPCRQSLQRLARRRRRAACWRWTPRSSWPSRARAARAAAGRVRRRQPPQTARAGRRAGDRGAAIPAARRARAQRLPQARGAALSRDLHRHGGGGRWSSTARADRRGADRRRRLLAGGAAAAGAGGGAGRAAPARPRRRCVDASIWRRCRRSTTCAAPPPIAATRRSTLVRARSRTRRAEALAA